MRDIGKQIRARREQLGWSTTKLATLAGLSQSFLWRLEAGRTNGSWETYTKVAGALGISVEKFFENKSNVEPSPLGWRRIPVLDYVQAGRRTGVDGTPKDDEIRETVMTHLEYPPDTFALRINEDSMEPVFRLGDIVVIDPTIKPRPGDCVVAKDESGETPTFRQYRNAGLNEHGVEVFELHPLNPLYAAMRSDRQQLTIVGTMVEHRKYRKP
jgi:SOS-response transcriptional repressor LexA